MNRIPVFDSGYRHLGVAFRSRRNGPESDLIDTFLEKKELLVPRGCRVAAFREPCLESGCPDLVLVVWHERTAQEWDSARCLLSTEDLRVMQFISQNGPTDADGLRVISGNNIGASLERISSAGHVRKVRGLWKARPLRSVYAIRSIVAIEAKMKEWETVLQQAWLNTWFASASYVLVPEERRTSSLVSRADERGIGVLTEHAEKIDLRKLSAGNQPLSYGSWLFNEWLWRAECASRSPAPTEDDLEHRYRLVAG